jgi:hypothetical protein
MRTTLTLDDDVARRIEQLRRQRGHGGAVASTDGDFGRFPGLRWENPIETSNPPTRHTNMSIGRGDGASFSWPSAGFSTRTRATLQLFCQPP